MTVDFDATVLACLERMGLELPEPSAPAGSYLPAARSGNLLFLSAQMPIQDGKVVYPGRVGLDLTPEEGYAAAKIAGLNTLARIRAELGDFNALKQIVRIDGHVASADDFFDQPGVIDGVSDLFNAVLDDRAGHARTAFGPRILPKNISIELAVIAEIQD
ncbi:RidA family protein [Aestuariispira insulae]|uniref:Enamine deaminase RidA (YjgF/YER057c/UK114 family) n=1 Tax=Aestuariispira insulae TaxID=1461337 RepID=A0A3D9HR98_9PROT|nr:RidA family protein [Aestuariispira insulae]RED52012.1 enamine deaminase RidA (YjgF/YER057c/UK114 family) [Aestuariispira insulae]